MVYDKSQMMHGTLDGCILKIISCQTTYGYEILELLRKSGFSDISEGFSYTETFKIVGENLAVVKQNGIDEKLEIGKTMEFVTAPGGWGDGYVYPIVEISVDGETLLGFEEGFPNFLEHLKKN